MTQPNWKPLEAALPLDECGDWMHMGTVEVPDCPPIEQYKHADSRQYVNLALTDRGPQAFDVRYFVPASTSWEDALSNEPVTPTVRSLPGNPTALLRSMAQW